MSINKNFVIKNGLEVDTNLIVADPQTNKVGIGTTVPQYLLHVNGGIGVTNAYVSGITTVINELRVGTGGTIFSVIAGPTGFGQSVGVGTARPAFLLDVRAPVSTGQTALYVQGDIRVTGDLNVDDISITNLNVSGISTFVGFATFQDYVFIQDGLNVTGTGATLASLNVLGVSTFVGFTTFNSNILVAGIGTITNLVSTSGTITNLVSTSGTITTLNGTNGTITNLVSTSGTITTLGSTNGTITNLVSTSGTITNLVSTSGTITTLGSTNGTITNLVSTSGTITTLGSTNGTITNLVSTSGTITNLVSTSGTITTFGSTNGTITTLGSTNGTITNLTGTSGTITTFNSTTGNITNLTNTNLNVTGIATIVTLNATGIGVTNFTVYNNLSVGGISTFTNGPLLIGTATSTGTASQPLQVTGGAYVSGSVGIGTTNPTSALFVVGDARVTGVITATTFSGNVNAGVGTITNLVSTSGTITNLVSTSGTITNLTGTNVSYSGISTLGTVKVSSGIITATSGIVTYFGDGNFLNLTSNPSRGIGIGTTGGVVGYAVTFINFKGTGVSTTQYNSNTGIATIFFQGGGSGSIGIGSTFAPGAVNGDLFFNIDYGRIFVYYDEVALGIGTDKYWIDAAPFNVGIITALTNVSFSPGSAISPSMFFVGDTQTGFFSPGNGQFTVVSSGSSVLNVNASGINVTGIATITNAAGTVKIGIGTTALLVEGNARVTGILTVGTGSITLNGSTNIINVGTGLTLSSSGINVTGIVTASSVVVSAGTTALPSISPTGDTNTGIFFPAADTISVSTGGTERVRIDSSGRLGIGTSGPGQNITVQSSASGTAPTFKLQNPIDSNSSEGAANNLSAGQLLFGATGAFPLTAKIESVYNANASFGRAAKLIISGANGAGTLTERVAIDEAGRVGIGTTSPGSALHVVGTSSLLGNGGAAADWGNTSTLGRLTYLSGNPIIHSVGGSTPLLFGTDLATERMRIDTSGRLLVGTITQVGNVNGGILQLGSGITFPATAVAASDANTLDDYEEGTWAPILQVNGTNSSSTVNLSGAYLKIGPSVHLLLQIYQSNTVPLNFNVGFTEVSGLPFSLSYGLQSVFGVGNLSGEFPRGTVPSWAGGRSNDNGRLVFKSSLDTGASNNYYVTQITFFSLGLM